MGLDGPRHWGQVVSGTRMVLQAAASRGRVPGAGIAVRGSCSAACQWAVAEQAGLILCCAPVYVPNEEPFCVPAWVPEGMPCTNFAGEPEAADG